MMVFTTKRFFEVAIESWGCVGFKPTTTEFGSDALNDRAIRP